MQPPQSLYSSSGWWALRSRCPSVNGRPLEFQVWQAASLMFGQGDSHIRTCAGPPVRRAGAWKLHVRVLPISHGKQHTRGRDRLRLECSKAQISTRNQQNYACTRSSVFKCKFVTENLHWSDVRGTPRHAGRRMFVPRPCKSQNSGRNGTGPSQYSQYTKHVAERASSRACSTARAERAVRERNEGAGLSRPSLIDLPKREGRVSQGAGA